MNKDKISVIIPAYQPDEKLLTTIQSLIASGFSDILVINDGSREETATLFAEAEAFPQCTVLHHPENRGKGAALKTAFQFFLENRPDRLCAVTADADGQHLTKDIEAVSLTALKEEKIVLGTRDFSDPNVPARSKTGNQITVFVFRLFFGMKIRDTQTGLRAFPRKYIQALTEIKGDRYEYETNQLFFINRNGFPLEQVNISTVYIDENKSSHFRVIRDSVRIYGLILKYLCSSVAASVIDALAFYILKKIAVLAFLPIPLTFSSAFIARAISSIINFFMNAKLVFGGNANKQTLLKYYTLAVAQIGISAVLVFITEGLLKIWSPALSTLVKIIIDTVLFFFSFRIQHKWVFNNKNTVGKESVQ